MKLFVINLFLLFLIGIHGVYSSQFCAGCPSESSPKDKDALELLNKAVTKQNSVSNEKPKRVINVTKVTKQVVAGIKYTFDFDAETVGSNKKSKCQTVIVHQPWISPEPQVLEYKCSDVSKRSVPGGPIDVTSKESEQVKELAEIGIETLDELDEDDNKRVITNVLSATKKLVNGIMYTISVEVKTTSCKEKGDVNTKCLADEVSPLKICKLHIYRSFADKSPFNAKVVKSECFAAKKDRSLINFNSAEYNSKVARLAAKRINNGMNSIVVLGVLKVLESDHAYESGLHQTSMLLELGDTNCTKKRSYDESECVFLPDFENHVICSVRVKHDTEKNNFDIDHNFSCKNIKKDVLSNRARRALTGDTIPFNVNAGVPGDLKTFISSEINQKTNSLFHKSVVKILSGATQATSGRYLTLLTEVADTNCLRSENTEVKQCIAQEVGRELCHVTLMDWSLLEIREVISIKCHPIERAMDIPGSAEILGVDEGDKDYLNFKSFTKKYDRSYPTTDVLKNRFRIFRANMKKADLLQQTDQGTAKYGATMFSDLTTEEFKKKYLGLKKINSDLKFKREVAHIPDITLPDEYDWRNYNVVTSVKNQGVCGSCWAFSVTGNIEGQYAIKTGNLVSLSEQELVDCDKYDNGCGGGWFDTAYHAIEDMGGLEGETDYPYSGYGGKCHFNSSEVRVSITSSVNISSDETDMAKWLVANGPISIALNANAMQFYMGGVSHPLKFLCDPKGLDHGVLLVGYGTHRTRFLHKNLPYWLIKNSWGPHWGHKGYYMLYRGDGSCGVNQNPSSAVL